MEKANIFKYSYYQNEELWDFMEDEQSYIISQIEQFISRYEKRYRTIVTDLVLIGNVGTWRGSFTGGKALQSLEDIFHSVSYDEMEINVNDDNTLEMIYIHHDGRHRMNLQFMTEGKKAKIGINENPNYWDWQEMEKIYNLPIPKIDKTFMENFGIKFTKKEVTGK